LSPDEKGRPRLGRGLSALLGDEASDYAALDQVRESKTVPIEYLRPNRYQPRRIFDAAELDSLAESIRAQGILQPILVRRDGDHANSYEIIAGERRWRAAQRARLHEVPVIIKDLSDAKALEVALVENVQRQDLNALEEAEGYRRLMEEFNHTQEDLAIVVGKSRSHVANTLRLLGLPEEVKALVAAHELSAGHARALLNAVDPVKLAKLVADRQLNVRQTEKLAQQGREFKAPAAELAGKDADTLALERDLSQMLGLKVTIEFRGGGGAVTIKYKTLEQLDDVVQRLSHPAPRGDRA
jgi:ParB family transcriptional regulator, chromosome partitioning protein